MEASQAFNPQKKSETERNAQFMSLLASRISDFIKTFKEYWPVNTLSAEEKKSLESLERLASELKTKVELFGLFNSATPIETPLTAIRKTRSRIMGLLPPEKKSGGGFLFSTVPSKLHDAMLELTRELDSQLATLSKIQKTDSPSNVNATLEDWARKISNLEEELKQKFSIDQEVLTYKLDEPIRNAFSAGKTAGFEEGLNHAMQLMLSKLNTLPSNIQEQIYPHLGISMVTPQLLITDGSILANSTPAYVNTKPSSYSLPTTTPWKGPHVEESFTPTPAHVKPSYGLSAANVKGENLQAKFESAAANTQLIPYKK